MSVGDKHTSDMKMQSNNWETAMLTLPAPQYLQASCSVVVSVLEEKYSCVTKYNPRCSFSAVRGLGSLWNSEDWLVPGRGLGAQTQSCVAGVCSGNMASVSHWVAGQL